MRYFQSVLAFGDSHVAGCELSNSYSIDQYLDGTITLENADAAGKDYAFPQIVADTLKLPCYNYALTGGSNDRSIRLLTQAVQAHPNSLVLFGYTCTDRTEFYYPDAGLFLGRDDNNFIQVGMQWEGMIDAAMVKSKMTHPINTKYLDILRPYNNLNQMMFIVDNICTLHACRFIHLPLFNEQFDEAVDNLFEFEGYKNYLDWCKANKFKQLPFLHYDHSAHKKLAELILNETLG